MAPLLNRPARVISVVAVAGTFILGSAPAVFAAAPANDTYDGRVALSDGYSATRDTTDATSDANDDAINANCGFVDTDASVWYELAGTDETYVIDVSASSYPAGAIVATGDPATGFTLVTCDLGRVGLFAAAGTTYTILVFDSQFDFEGNGGSLSISVDTTVAPSLDTFAIDPDAQISSDGSATVTGTAACRAKPLAYTQVEVTLTQRQGKTETSASRGVTDGFTCDGMVHNWAVTVQADSGLFKAGRATVTGLVQVCSFTKCDGSEFAEPVKLRNGSGPVFHGNGRGEAHG